MDSVLSILKSRARDLHRHAVKGDVESLAAIARLPEMRDAPLGDLSGKVQRKHCLATVARELGFPGWPSLSHFLTGEQSTQFGTVLYPGCSNAFTNIWSASYDEAKEIQLKGGGYLLAYKTHFFVAQAAFIENLGLDPDAADWHRIRRDWVAPDDLVARNKLFRQLIV